MNVFRVLCKDQKTGYQMVASECSYNMACDWLSREIIKENSEICRCEYNVKTELYEIWTATWDESTATYRPNRKFFYDEERGYLLGE